jgi:N6-adenosine-specific RNA methylase IME4
MIKSMEKKYNVIYADPPWQYKQKKTGRSNNSGAKDKYNTMPLHEIQNMPIADICENDSLLFMWATIPLLPQAMSVIPAWGFEYKTLIVWEKTGILGMGNWLRIQTEMILVGIRGEVRPFEHQEKNIYKHPICEHSAKPHFFRELVMKLSAKSLDRCERLELFARSREGMFSNYEYEGWDVFGNQVENSIMLPEWKIEEIKHTDEAE